MHRIIRKLLALTVILLPSASFAAIETDGVTGDGRVSLIYDPTDGRIALDAAIPVAIFEVISASGIFTGQRPELIQPPFDVFTPSKLFFIRTAGISDTDFGLAAAPGLSKSFLGGDLTISGSGPAVLHFAGGADLVYVPEPSSVSLLAVGLLTCGAIRRSSGLP